MHAFLCVDRNLDAHVPQYQKARRAVNGSDDCDPAKATGHKRTSTVQISHAAKQQKLLKLTAGLLRLDQQICSPARFSRSYSIDSGKHGVSHLFSLLHR